MTAASSGVSLPEAMWLILLIACFGFAFWKALK